MGYENAPCEREGCDVIIERKYGRQYCRPHARENDRRLKREWAKRNKERVASATREVHWSGPECEALDREIEEWGDRMPPYRIEARNRLVMQWWEGSGE